MMQAEQLSSSLEDYLETILSLQQQRSVARAKDIGSQLRVNRSSVTTALQALARRGLVNYSPYDFITLTDRGRNLAQDVASRHEVMREFLTKVLRVDESEASDAACKLEHALTGTVRKRMVQFLDFVNRCPAGLAEWSEAGGFRCVQEKPQTREICDTCRGSVPAAGQRRTRKRK